LAARWSGSSWALQSTPNPAPLPVSASYADVSCGSASQCLAVGHDEQSDVTLHHVWNGSTWEAIKSPALAGSASAVSCDSATSCMVLGADSEGDPRIEKIGVLVGQWGRFWTKEPPTPEGGTDPKLNDVSCTSSSACTAVGSYYNGTKRVNLALRWNGSTWSIQTTPNPEVGAPELLSVSCDSATSCMAVGKRAALSVTFAMRWDGSTWAITSTPSPPVLSESALREVSCASASSCVAVGAYKDSTTNNQWRLLTQRWNGSSWSTLTNPSPAGAVGSVELSGISCTASNACTAVGEYVSQLQGSKATEVKTLVQVWNGAEWTTQTSPNPEGRKISSFAGVSCTASNACAAVGRGIAAHDTPESFTLAARYD
jgi:hypothetical protein